MAREQILLYTAVRSNVDESVAIAQAAQELKIPLIRDTEGPLVPKEPNRFGVNGHYEVPADKDPLFQQSFREKLRSLRIQP